MTDYRTIEVDGLEIFYREAGPKEAPTILLLHGFPSSSHYYRNLITALSGDYHLVAPDYPGFGNSDSPALDKFEYSFDNLSKVMEKFIRKIGLNKFSLFVQDYGGPVGFRIAARHPERIEALIIQNSNAYEEGIGKGFDPVRELWKDRNENTEKPLRGVLTHDTVKYLYVNGEPEPAKVSPDAWNMDLYYLNLPGRVDIQIELLYDYQNNLKGYPQLQEYFRNQQPPTLVVWGTNDIFFTNEGGTAYKRDLKNIEVRLLDGGHFTLESHADEMAGYIKQFLGQKINAAKKAAA